MRREMRIQIMLGIGFTVMTTAGATLPTAHADAPQFQPPHGMLRVELDDNDKLFADSGAAMFDDPSFFTTNVLGQTILRHNLGGDNVIGGIAEVDGDSFNDPEADEVPATPASTRLLTDEPGFLIGGEGFPADIRVSVNLHNNLQYFAPGGTHWTDPPNGERILVKDLIGGDNTVADTDPPELIQDLEVLITEDTFGALGTISLDISQPPQFPGFPPPLVHAHVGYELSRPDADTGGIPAMGAYMIELTLSGKEFPGPGGLELEDSQPIFVVFNNQLDEAGYNAAVTAAEAISQPGDANKDAKVDAADLNVLALSWQQAVAPSTGADFNGDGFVDAADLNLLALNWQFGVGQPEAAVTFEAAVAAALPEPTTIVTFIAMGAGLIGWRRRDHRFLAREHNR